MVFVVFDDGAGEGREGGREEEEKAMMGQKRWVLYGGLEDVLRLANWTSPGSPQRGNGLCAVFRER